MVGANKQGEIDMSSTAIATVIKMMESLPEPAQDQVVEHLREYLEDLQDELQWDTLFKKTQPQLIAAARRAKKEIAEGLAQPMDYDQL
jgi:hypothetical protein